MEVVVAVIVRNDEILICRRRDDAAHLAGYWEFPGGKREPGESIEECLARELREELAIRTHIVHVLTPIEHDYPAVHVRLIPFLCGPPDTDPRPVECQHVVWVAPNALQNYTFPPANARLIEQIAAHLSGRST